MSHERTPLKINQKESKEKFFILTKYDRPVEDTSKKKKKKPDARKQADEEKHEMNMIKSLAILQHTELALNDIITRATRDEIITPIIVAFMIVGDVYSNIPLNSIKSFEHSPEQYTLGDTRAISEDQLCLDMMKFPSHYKSMAGVLIYLHAMESPMHTIIHRQQLRVKNESDGFFERWMTPFHSGYYYKLIVNFAQTKPNCTIY